MRRVRDLLICLIAYGAIRLVSTVITKDVKENSLVLERSEQEEIENYKKKK